MSKLKHLRSGKKLNVLNVNKNTGKKRALRMKTLSKRKTQLCLTSTSILRICRRSLMKSSLKLRFLPKCKSKLIMIGSWIRKSGIILSLITTLPKVASDC